MKHLSKIQVEFVKLSMNSDKWWNGLTYEQQKEYLQKVKHSRFRVTKNPNIKSEENIKSNKPSENMDDYGYHISYLSSLDGVKSNGLKALSGEWAANPYSNRVYFANEPNEAWYYVSQRIAQEKDKPKPLLLRVKKTDLQDANNLKAREFFVNRDIPVDHIEVFQNGKWIKLSDAKKEFSDFSEYLRGADKTVFDKYYKE